MATYDTVIIGAGPFGLIAAHTWLELNPDANVVILEAGPDLGGAWSKSRVYPTMMTQSPQDMIEYSCLDMPRLDKKDTFYDFFPGSVVNTYLESFSVHKKFGDKTIKDRIIFNSLVKSVSKSNKLWTVQTEDSRIYTCPKLIVATGLTSTPNKPSFKTKDFKPPIIHGRDLALQTPLFASGKVKNAVVLGGGKSSFDATTLLNSLNIKVTWIIRLSGQGPALLSTPDAPWPLSNSHEIISTRFITKQSPCIFEPVDNWAKFYHSSTIGVWLCDQIWNGIGKMWAGAANYDRSENMKNLKPDRPVFWSSDGIAVFNSPGLWDTVSNATILRDEVESLEDTEVVLKSGERINCDALVTCTGYHNTYPMFDDMTAVQLGLPLPASKFLEFSEDIKTWEERIKSADPEVLIAFPRLATQPTYPDHAPKSSPSRLYRGIIPIDDPDHSIAFVGAIGTVQSFTVAEVQALWATAYLTGTMELPKQEEMEHDVALTTAWRRRRYLGDGYTFIYDQIPYTSMLLRDMGINDLRKGGGWRELLSPYRASDYKGILQEWKDKQDGRAKTVA
ncbi:hypothetical protein BGZ60DRAFT_528702 [Tricladium varicosporioides]|nr:hypothetical protein BGZ60DRAFT_528702 [Hymenoscyphus varicosporioides]